MWNRLFFQRILLAVITQIHPWPHRRTARSADVPRFHNVPSFFPNKVARSIRDVQTKVTESQLAAKLSKLAGWLVTKKLSAVELSRCLFITLYSGHVRNK